MSLFHLDTPVTTNQVVDTFLGFFTGRDHLDVGGSSLVPQNDPSLLFINSGMAPMKPYFLGHAEPPQPNLCNVQGCIRTNDIEDVGDRHHLTYFEMMGSWSVGEYWKETAIRLALELLTEGFGFPIERLYATVYSGERERGLPPDDDSAGHWLAAGLKPEQIVPLGADNFWGPAGQYGPCGPCTEVFYDTGEQYGPAYVPGSQFDDKNRYIEIWNAGVFMQYDLREDGFQPLRTQCVDTGSGLERMVMTLNGMESVYEVDTLASVLAAAARILGDDEPSPAARIICDHVRAGVHILAEGVLPSNTGPGYIPRRLIRRSMALLSQAGQAGLALDAVIDAVFEQTKPWSRLREDQHDAVTRAIREEQKAFESALSRGLKALDQAISSRRPPSLSSEEAFQLFSTYGLPVDTIRERVEREGGEFDRASFARAMERHQDVSRADAVTDTDLPEELASHAATSFEGVDAISGEGTILGVIRDGEAVEVASEGERVQLLLDKTVFYPEGGGQVGDRGVLTTADAKVAVGDTTKTAGGHILHHAIVSSGTARPGERATLEVEPSWRAGSRVHHSATHLLNAALRKVLGDQVSQRGSLVQPDRLRFDFDHPRRVSAAELREIENHVNGLIRENRERKAEIMPYQAAIAEGAQAVFTEKYGDEVRVVRFGPTSVELCGGTHVRATGDIGFFVVEAETAVARGIRRISALAGEAALARIQVQRDLLAEIALRLGVNEEAVLPQLEQRMARPAAEEKKAVPEFDDLKNGVTELADGTPALLAEVSAEIPQLRDAAADFADRINGIVCLVTKAESALRLVVAVAKPVREKLSASDVLTTLLPMVDGNGGGNQRLAMGGGKKLEGWTELQERFVPTVSRLLGQTARL